jgi:hypothetical protein
MLAFSKDEIARKLIRVIGTEKVTLMIIWGPMGFMSLTCFRMVPDATQPTSLTMA